MKRKHLQPTPIPWAFARKLFIETQASDSGRPLRQVFKAGFLRQNGRRRLPPEFTRSVMETTQLELAPVGALEWLSHSHLEEV